MSSKLLAGSIGMLAIALLVPAGLFAAEESKASFCARITEISGKIDTRIEEQTVKTEELRATQAAKLAKHRADVDERLKETRLDADLKRNDHFDTLLQQTSSPELLTALNTFKTTVESEVSERRTAVEAALKTYRDGMDAAVATHRQGVNDAQAKLKNTVTAAVAKAKSDCASGAPNNQAIKTAFEKTIQDAQGVFKKEVQALIVAVREKHEGLADARSKAVDTAIEDFRKALEAARATLRTATQNS